MRIAAPCLKRVHSKMDEWERELHMQQSESTFYALSCFVQAHQRAQRFVSPQGEFVGLDGVISYCRVVFEGRQHEFEFCGNP